nr:MULTISPECIES: hypothetical protein [unclassified Mesorhizobium]
MSFPGYTTYSATKAAVRSFARTWTAALRDRGTDIAANVRNRTDSIVGKKSDRIGLRRLRRGNEKRREAELSCAILAQVLP